jgi:hypothetical protein
MDKLPQLDEVMRCVMAIRSGGAAGDGGISPVVYKTLMSDPTTQHLIMDLVHRKIANKIFHDVVSKVHIWTT